MGCLFLMHSMVNVIKTGSGHFSPIGGYHVGRDMALVLDVARFKYPPHWVPLSLLWEAMGYVDKSTGQQRGFMLISRPHREPGLLYTLSCKNESWVGIAKYLMDDVSLLLKSADVKDIENVLSLIFTSLPSNFGEFIKWIAEVRRREDGDQSLSPEEKARVNVKEEVLKQVQETGLFKHVSAFLSSANSCCRNLPLLSHQDNFPDIAASVCCQGAEILAGISGASVSGTVVNGKSEHGVDVLFPSSQMKPGCCCSVSSNYIGIHPASNDVLTALLLALPPETWSGIKNEKVLLEISSLALTENLPTLLQEEVLHLRRQLYLLKRCQENKVDVDLGAPLS
ncbi:hypothetical protein CIPAW_03G267500 [Carya illinoinensis]|uniref:Peptidase C83 domain-containing protein n=1 Tax=Carya illinoinensis TaxID=32201 RepID=A0A8T1R8U5_CARIL|nr:hypothetical protein CIPAW_03G267500 [Carya illinoinensis]